MVNIHELRKNNYELYKKLLCGNMLTLYLKYGDILSIEELQEIKKKYISRKYYQGVVNQNKKLKEKQKKIEKLYKQEKEKNKKLTLILNAVMPLAECVYWNYETHTCTHTCRGCDDLTETNRRCSSGLLINKDRYCLLYTDGYSDEETKYVNVEDLIKRHSEGLESLEKLLKEK